MLNVVEEALPPERESRFSAVALGAGAYAAPLLFVRSTGYRYVSPG